MKRTNIFYGNQFVDSMYCGVTKWQVFKYKAIKLASRVFFMIIALDVIGWSILAGYHYAKAKIAQTTVYAENRVEVPVFEVTPVMERIAKCESNSSHYRDGQVIFNTNKDGTVDIGYYQINSIHNKDATALGYDLTKEEDNKAYAAYLYKNYGTEPWYSSKKCWNK